MQNGERRGPFRVFQVKEMIDRGEAAVTDLGWHHGMDAWLPLTEIDSLRAFVPRTTPPPLPEPDEEQPADPQEAMATPGDRPLLHGAETSLSRWELFGTRALPRFIARLLDDTLFFAFLTAGGVAARWLDPFTFAAPGAFLLIGQALVWVLVEASLLHRFGRTPGKWLLNLRVVDREGGPPSWPRALKRSFFICACAWAFGLQQLWIFGSAVSLMLFLNNGLMVWDYLASTRVVHGGPRPVRLFLAAAFVVAYWSAKVFVIFTQPIPADIDPEVRRRLEEARSQALSLPRPVPPAKP